MWEDEIKRKTYAERVKHHPNLIAKKLLNIMHQKNSNLCVSVDVLNKSSFLKIVNAVADHVCMIKTHIDIIQDFDQDLIHQLTRLSKQKNFLIFEDRKFADIGNTVKYQYSSGIYKISEWSDITNAHTVPGEGVITGLSQVGQKLGRGLLLLAEMSSTGNLAKEEYTSQSLQMATRHKDFVIGFIAQRRLESLLPTTPNQLNHDFLVLSPGVALDINQDQLGQNYRTPHQVIYQSGADIIIVGRAIYGQIDNLSSDQVILEQTIRYKQAGWQAYLQRLSSPST